MGLNGEVHVWYMTEEERLAYIEKHPIIPTKKTIVTFDNLDSKDLNERRKKALEKARMAKDYKWRSQKAAEASKEARQNK